MRSALLVYLVLLGTTLGCDQTAIDYLLYPDLQSGVSIAKTDKTITTLKDNSILEADTQNNKILCKDMFGDLYKFQSVLFIAPYVEQLEPDFFHGQQVIKSIAIISSKIRTIKKDTFKDLPVQFLELKNNEISTIENEAFVNLPFLETLDLGENQLISLNPDSFVGLPKLSNFFANNNQIAKLQHNVFKFLNAYMTHIDLTDNQIAVLDEEVFNWSAAENVALLLGGNSIRCLSGGSFQGRHFKEVRLEGNEISTISDEFFEECTDIAFLDLSFNPLNNETLEVLESWSVENGIIFRYSLNSAGGHLSNYLLVIGAFIVVQFL
jgi:Leucine-rich repeat (LRR) protein